MTKDLNPQQLSELAHHVLAICTILELQIPVAQAPDVVYPSATKAQLAAAAGTNPRTFNRWLQPLQTELYQMGVSPKAKQLPPVAVKLICERLVIDASALHD